MRGDALVAMEHLDHLRGVARPHLLTDQGVGHRVVVLVDLHVVVEARAALLPLGKLIRLGRKWLECGILDLFKQGTAARPEVTGHAGVDLLNQFTDRSIELGNREERAIAQLCGNPACCDLYCDLYLGFVTWFTRPRGDDNGAVVLRHIRVRTIDVRLVETRLSDAGLQIVADDHIRYTAKIREGACMRADPVGKRLCPRGFRERVRARTQNRDEQLCCADLAGSRSDYLQPGAGIVDEHPLTGDVRLPHRRRNALLPGAVKVAEARIAVPAGVLLRYSCHSSSSV